ncbi:hypothetical protein AHAS_Ahas19G0336100 [Arachis hypogaea]
MPNLDPLVCRNMEMIPTDMEIKKVLFSIGSLKAPGEDEFPAIFFKNNWEVLKRKVCDYIKDCWRNPTLLKDSNSTLIVLIPKLQHPEFITQFRPIVLCNVGLKILTKILVQRPKPHLNDRISPHQSSFIPGRKIQDNILIAKEVMHSMKKMKGKKNYMAIKIDFEKAYDTINWNFIQERLLELKLPEKIIHIIMEEENPNSLWAKVLIQKYCNGDSNINNPTARKVYSNLWKEILKIWPTFQKHTMKFVGDGTTTRFWTERWVNNEGSLLNIATMNITNIESTRNKKIHEPNYNRPQNTQLEVMKKVAEVKEAFQRRVENRINKNKEIRNIRWMPLSQERMTLNIDGTVQGSKEKAGCGGLLRNGRGKWVAGFSFNIGRCTAYMAKLWGNQKGNGTSVDFGDKEN